MVRFYLALSVIHTCAKMNLNLLSVLPVHGTIILSKCPDCPLLASVDQHKEELIVATV